MKERLFAAGMRQHSGLGIIDEHLKWNTAQELEGVLMSAQEVFGRLAEAKFEVRQAAVAKHHDKERQSPPGGADSHRTGAAPIDLRALARSKRQGEEGRRTHPAYRAHIVFEDGEPAGVTFLGTESLEDLGGRVSMSFQPALNDDFVGLELTFARERLASLGVILGTSPFSHRLFIEVQLTGDLGKIQAALLMQEPDLRVKLVGDHGCCGPPDSNI